MKLTPTVPMNCFAAVCMVLSVGCSGKVAHDAAAGGSPNNIIDPGSGGGSASTGGSPSFTDRCNGLFNNIQICSASSFQGVVDCDIPLNSSPRDPTMLEVALDCELVPLVPRNIPDAGNGDGFIIDYNWNPAHLLLLGGYCGLLQATGVHNIDVFEQCVAGGR